MTWRLQERTDPEIFEEYGALGLLGMTPPAEYDGNGIQSEYHVMRRAQYLETVITQRGDARHPRADPRTRADRSAGVRLSAAAPGGEDLAHRRRMLRLRRASAERGSHGPANLPAHARVSGSDRRGGLSRSAAVARCAAGGRRSSRRLQDRTYVPRDASPVPGDGADVRADSRRWRSAGRRPRPRGVVLQASARSGARIRPRRRSGGFGGEHRARARRNRARGARVRDRRSADG